jgi:hypothetical protein
MPKSQSEKTQNLSPVTEARLEKLLSEQTKDLEQLLADQANVILEAVAEQMDKKMDQKLDPVINKLDAILGEVQKHREEDVRPHSLECAQTVLEKDGLRLGSNLSVAQKACAS